MSKIICIMGESGSGKTTSLRTLPPNETFFIDADGKGLSWKGWRTQYSIANKNYFKTDIPANILHVMQKIDKEQKQFKYLVVDTLNGVMVGDEMRRAREKGYDKWMDLAQSVYNIVTLANTMRDDLTVIFTAHTQTDIEDTGYNFTHIKTNGKKLNKICLESKMNTVLLAKCVGGKYIFETAANNSSTKTPMGAFEEKEIPNDIMLVINALKDY